MTRFSYCFNLASSMLAAVPAAIIAATATENFIRRRFGVSSSGTAVAYNILGEPVDLTADIYIDLAFEGTIKKQMLDANGKVIGAISDDKEKIEVYIDPALDIVKGDLVLRVLPANNNRWFKIDQIVQTSSASATYLIGFAEVRSTK